MENVNHQDRNKSIEGKNSFARYTQDHPYSFQKARLLKVYNLVDFFGVILVLLIDDTSTHNCSHIVNFFLLLDLIFYFFRLVNVLSRSSMAAVLNYRLSGLLFFAQLFFFGLLTILVVNRGFQFSNHLLYNMILWLMTNLLELLQMFEIGQRSFVLPHGGEALAPQVESFLLFC